MKKEAIAGHGSRVNGELAKELARRDFSFAYDGATGCFVVWVDEEDDAEDWAAVRSWFRTHFGEDMAAQLVEPESVGPVAVEPGRPKKQ